MLGVRLGLFIAAGVFIADVVFSLFTETFLSAISHAILHSILAFVISFGVVHFSIHSRINQILSYFDDIISKRFDEPEVHLTKIRDEVDVLLIQTSRVTESVEREINRLRKIESYRKEFIGDVSHELKTPIFAVQGFIETLLNGAMEDPSVNRLFLEKAMRNVNRLTILTQDLMEISKLETGELKSDFTMFELSPLVNEVIESLQYKAEREQVTLSCDSDLTGINVYADRNQIRQVVNNLVENAIKYNVPHGSVSLKVRIYPKDAKKYELMVKDTGLGIDPKYVARVTERFFRIDKSRSREKGGTGLGLSIVKHIMEAHGERLMISSSPQQGSTFSISLANADLVEM